MSEHRNALYFPSAAADAASEYFNALPQAERAKLAPLLEHYRQMGLAEAADNLRAALGSVTDRAKQIKAGGEVGL